jgi:hypothetical protein
MDMRPDATAGYSGGTDDLFAAGYAHCGLASWIAAIGTAPSAMSVTPFVVYQRHSEATKRAVAKTQPKSRTAGETGWSNNRVCAEASPNGRRLKWCRPASSRVNDIGSDRDSRPPRKRTEAGSRF